MLHINFFVWNTFSVMKKIRLCESIWQLCYGVYLQDDDNKSQSFGKNVLIDSKRLRKEKRMREKRGRNSVFTNWINSQTCMYICSRDSCSCYIEEMDMKGRDLDQQYEKESEVVDSITYCEFGMQHNCMVVELSIYILR